MQIKTTKIFENDYLNLSEEIKERANKQLSFLLKDPHHPSLRLKKIKGKDNIWEARITQNYRITFQIDGDICLLRRIGKHDEVLKKP
ncbi:MAG: type II toxin-antitoxin system RelE/ParE family toxin [Candidatus Poribacteria bacterium]